MAYKDFTDQRDWPSKQLSLYSSLLSGTPVSPNTTTTVTEPGRRSTSPPSAAARAAVFARVSR